MNTTKFITSEEMAQELGISKSHAYKLLRQLNDELKAKDFLTVAGKVSRKFFEERFYGMSQSEMKGSE